MITIKDFMEVVNYKITEGSDYLWQSFGHNAYRLDCWSGAADPEKDDYTVGVIFDTVTQIVYQFEAHDYKNQRSYRWTNPDFVKAFNDEVQKKLTDSNKDVAYDNVKFVDLDVPKDILNKAQAIVKGLPYDTRVSVPIDLDHDELFTLMTLAHERDITLNQLVEEILTNVINKESKNEC